MISYDSIYEDDYKILTEIMKNAFDDDTRIHTDLQEDGPCGYNDGTLIRKLNTNKDYISQKIMIDETIVGAYTISFCSTDYTLEMLFLNPTTISKGVGTRVWKHIEENYADASKWYVETPDYSKRNHHFYMNKCGFHFIRENIYEGGEKSFIFMKEVEQ